MGCFKRLKFVTRSDQAGVTQLELSDSRRVYDGDGRRIVRGAYSYGTWQVYGFEGELLAEYAANSVKILPQKEYGYQGGKLLITASNGDNDRLRRFVENIYLRTWGVLPVEGRKQADVNTLAATMGNNGQANTTAMLTAAQAQLTAAFDHPNYANVTRTNEQYVADLYLAYLQRAPEPGAITWYANFLNSNQLTRLQLRTEFANGPEFAWIVNALWGAQSGDYDRIDRFANQVYTAATGNLPSGGQYTFEHNRFDTAEAKGLNDVRDAGKELGRYLLGATPHDQNGDNLPFAYRNDLSTTEYVTRLYQTFLRTAPDSGLSGYITQADAPNGRNSVLEQFLSKPAYAERSGALYREIFWLISDHLGTPRLIAERTGKLEGIKRSDYLPFGEVANSLGGRTPAQGYVSESVRQGFTAKERDDETGLDYFLARSYSSAQGRFTSPDEFTGGPTELFADVAAHNPIFYAEIAEPQSLNKYHYCLNNPFRFVDPDGHQTTVADSLWAAGQSVVNSIREVGSTLVGNFQRATGASNAPEENRRPGPLGNKDQVVQAASEKAGKAAEVTWRAVSLIDPTGISGAIEAGAKNAAGRGSKAEVAFSIGGVFLGMVGGNKANIAFGEARALVKNWSVDTTFAKGLGKLVTHAFEGHGADVGARNIWQYLRKAASFNTRGTTRQVFEDGTRIRYIRKDGTYLITDANGKFISFGRN